MRILVLGGSWFLGKHIAAGALQRGWAVTTFNRGRSGRDVDGVEPIHGDRTNRADLERLADHGRWDAVIDTSSSEFSPRDVLAAATALSRAARRWVHISTVSVYEGWPHQPLTDTSPLLLCTPDADESFGYTGADGSPTKYGFQKAGGERAVTEAFGGWSAPSEVAASSPRRLPSSASNRLMSGMWLGSPSIRPPARRAAASTSRTARASRSAASSTPAWRRRAAPGRQPGSILQCSSSRG
jgi:hypothetical protein